MKKTMFAIFFAVLLGWTSLILVPEVQASSSLYTILTGQPCSGGWQIQAGYPPSATCWGVDRTVVNRTLIPVPRAYNSAPQYPLVGLVTGLGVDWDPSSFGEVHNQTDLRRQSQEWFAGYRVELQMRPFNQSGDVFNPVTQTNRRYALKDIWNQVDWGYASSYFQKCQHYSLEMLSINYGGTGGCRSASVIQRQLGNPYVPAASEIYRTDSAKSDWFWLGSEISSKNGSSQKYGEPAFGVKVTTEWSVWARSNWDHYYQWDCHDEIVLDPVTGLPLIDPLTGKPLTQQVCKWKDTGSGGGNPYTYLGTVLLDRVVVPGEGAMPLVPVPVFQSQPLLSVP